VPEEETPAPPDETATSETTPAEVTLAGAERVFDLQGGVSSPTGPMVISPGLNSAIVYQDGMLSYLDFSSGVPSPIEAGSMPMWSPRGEVLLYQKATDVQSSAIATWDPVDGSIYAVTGNEEPEGGPANDVPAGWIGDQLYYLRIFNVRPGYVELHRADWKGEDDQMIWSKDGVTLSADHPISTRSAILIPTDTSWLSITEDGTETDLGANSTGAVGDALVYPGASLIVYAAGGQLNLASTSSPGSVIATVPFPDGGFDFSPDGSQFVTAGSDGLAIFSTADGSDINFIANGEGMHATAPAWTDDGILFLDIGAEPAMRRYVI
jgi:WD40 repeat protein